MESVQEMNAPKRAMIVFKTFPCNTCSTLHLRIAFVMIMLLRNSLGKSIRKEIYRFLAENDFHRSLLFPVIPIVMGGANYKAIAPPKSYIDVNDFDSPKQLAQFLIKLSKNKVRIC